MSQKEEVEAPETDVEAAIDQATQEVAVQAAELAELADGTIERDGMEIDHLMDVPIEVTVELGHCRMTLGELARLATGSLVRLDREAHEPASLLVNGKKVAYGEIVTIGQSYGVRISRVVA